MSEPSSLQPDNLRELVETVFHFQVGYFGQEVHRTRVWVKETKPT
jgi:hypothetical protein